MRERENWGKTCGMIGRSGGYKSEDDGERFESELIDDDDDDSFRIMFISLKAYSKSFPFLHRITLSCR